MAKKNSKKSPAATIAATPVAQPAALLVNAAPPQTSVHVPLQTSDIVEAAGYQWSEVLTQRVETKRQQIAELTKTIATLEKAVETKLQIAVHAALKAEAEKWAIVATPPAGFDLVFPAPETFPLSTLRLFTNTWTEPAALKLDLQATQKKGENTCRLNLALTMVISPTVAGRVMSAVHNDQADLTAHRATLATYNAEHAKLLQEANDLPRFKKRFAAHLTMGALQNSGDTGMAFNELISQLVHQADAALSTKLLSVQPTK